MLWYVVYLGEGILSVESAEGDPIGKVVAGPFDTERQAIVAYVSIIADAAEHSEVIYN